MSSYTYGCTENGLIINGENYDYFIKRYIELNPDEFKDIPKEERYEELENWLYCKETLTRSCMAGKKDKVGFDAFLLPEDDDTYYPDAFFLSVVEDTERIRAETPVILVYARRNLSSRNVLTGNFYSSKEELAEEFKEDLSEYLPADFDWLGNIGDLDYASYC